METTQTFSPWAVANDPRKGTEVWINDGPDCYCCDCGKRLVWYSCPSCDTDRDYGDGSWREKGEA